MNCIYLAPVLILNYRIGSYDRASSSEYYIWKIKEEIQSHSNNVVNQRFLYLYIYLASVRIFIYRFVSYDGLSAGEYWKWEIKKEIQGHSKNIVKRRILYSLYISSLCSYFYLPVC